MIGRFEEFKEHIPLMNETGLDAINNFGLAVEFPRSHDLNTNRDMHRVLAARLYRNVAEILEAAELYDINNLVVGWYGDGTLRAEYQEPSLGFSVEITNDLEVRIVRTGSSLRFFHEWYRIIMPFAHGLVSRASIDLTDVLGVDFDLSPLRAQYRFVIVAFDFRPTHIKDFVKSHQVIGKILPSRPGSDGRLRKIEEGAAQTEDFRFARVDMKMSHVLQIAPNVYIREVYDIQAPSNQGYRGIWFDFGCIAEALDTGNPSSPHTHTQPQPEFLLEHYEIPYEEFFRKRAVGGFMTDLLKHFTFSCTTGAMP